MTKTNERDSRVIRETLTFYRETLDWLIHHHADYGRKTSHDLQADERDNAIWKLSGQSLAHSTTLMELLERGYTGQTWPTMRAIHEVNRLLVAVTDPAEDRIVNRWLGDQEVKQADARAAEQRQAARLAEQIRAADVDSPAENIEQFSRTIYRGMSKAAHHRRSVVDEAVDPEERTMIYGADPRIDQQLDYTIFAGALMYEVLLLVGDALCVLWGASFYDEHLVHMLRRFEEVLTALDIVDFAKQTGF